MTKWMTGNRTKHRTWEALEAEYREELNFSSSFNEFITSGNRDGKKMSIQVQTVGHESIYIYVI